MRSFPCRTCSLDALFLLTHPLTYCAPYCRSSWRSHSWRSFLKHSYRQTDKCCLLLHQLFENKIKKINQFCEDFSSRLIYLIAWSWKVTIAPLFCCHFNKCLLPFFVLNSSPTFLFHLSASFCFLIFTTTPPPPRGLLWQLVPCIVNLFRVVNNTTVL